MNIDQLFPDKIQKPIQNLKKNDNCDSQEEICINFHQEAFNSAQILTPQKYDIFYKKSQKKSLIEKTKAVIDFSLWQNEISSTFSLYNQTTFQFYFLSDTQRGLRDLETKIVNSSWFEPFSQLINLVNKTANPTGEKLKVFRFLQKNFFKEGNYLDRETLDRHKESNDFVDIYSCSNRVLTIYLVHKPNSQLRDKNLYQRDLDFILEFDEKKFDELEVLLKEITSRVGYFFPILDKAANFELEFSSGAQISKIEQNKIDSYLLNRTLVGIKALEYITNSFNLQLKENYILELKDQIQLLKTRNFSKNGFSAEDRKILMKFCEYNDLDIFVSTYLFEQYQ